MNSSRTKDALLAAASAVICLFAGEAGARWMLAAPVRLNRPTVFAVLHQADPLIGWVMSPERRSFHHRLTDDHGVVQFDVAYSLAGGTRLTSQLPHDGPALVAAGCSFTFGHALKDEQTWPWLLQDRLPQYRVINAGCEGYGSDQALLAAERQIRQNPGRTAAVVLGFGDFQIERNRASQLWMVTVYPFAKPMFTVTAHGAEYKGQVRFWPAGALAEHSDLFAHVLNAFANRFYGVPSHVQARELTTAIITTFAMRFQALGVRLAVVMLPYADDGVSLARADREFVVRRLRANQIPVLEPDFPRGKGGGIESGDFMASRIDRHPNARYNALLTAQMLPFLRANGIVAP